MDHRESVNVSTRMIKKKDPYGGIYEGTNGSFISCVELDLIRS